MLPLSDHKGGLPVVLDRLVSPSEARELDIGVFGASVLVDEVVHTKHTTHPSSVISEEDTTESRKGDDEVGSNGDGRLDAIDVGRAVHGDHTSTRHVCCAES